jgi:peptide chain release factor subunit 1
MITAEAIDRIIRFHGKGLPITSVYLDLPEDPAERAGRALHTRVKDLLHEVAQRAEDESLEHDVRLSLRADVERITERVGEGGRWGDAHGLALFSCGGRDWYEEVALPRRVRDRVMVDRTPWVRPMLAVLDEYHRACVVVLDKHQARVWEVYISEVREVEHVRDQLMRKPEVDEKRDLELTKRHYRRVAGIVADLFRSQDYELLIIGGHDDEIGQFRDLLPKVIQDRLADTFEVDVSTVTEAVVKEKANAIIDEYEREEEIRLVGEAVELAAMERGWGVVGVRECLWAGSVAAIDTLLVQEGAVVPGVVCDENHWLAPEGEVRGFCEGEPRHTQDVIDELCEWVIAESGRVEHVQVDTTELKDYLTAAILRFPLPELPDE